MLKEQLQRAGEARPEQALPAMLRAVRLHLGMEVAFISEFSGGRRVFRHVDCAADAAGVRAGKADPLEETCCARVVDGRLPQLMRDAREVPAAAAVPAVRELPVGAHLSVPIRLADGTVYGTFCCFSRAPDHSLNERDLAMMSVLAELAGEEIERDLAARRRHDEIVARIRSLLEGDAISPVYQPIFDLERGSVAGFECLSRFPSPPRQGPDVWFAEAASVGLGEELELRALERALPALRALDGVYLSLNVSPRLPAQRLADLLADRPAERLVLEITEHEVVEEYDRLSATLQPLRERGARVAVDDAGAGYASFRHILRLRPDYIKLDLSLTRNIHCDPARRALAVALIGFARDTGSRIVAEGVETQEELAVLRALGVAKAQGYLLGRPAPLAEALRLRERAQLAG